MSPEPRYADCPFCGEEIRLRAARCRHCGEYLDDEDEEDEEAYRRRRRRHSDPSEGDAALSWLVPVSTSGWSIAAGYLGLLSCFPLVGLLFGIGAVVTGILALKQLDKNPQQFGKGCAIFGLVAGGLAGTFNGIVVVILVYQLLKG